MINILQKGDPLLRVKATQVPLTMIKTPKIKNALKKMRQALYEQDDGVAIAAPQIGEPLRIFMVSGRIFSKDYPDIKPDEKIEPDLIFINPKLIKLSKQKKNLPEGCLSVRWLYGNVSRSTKATVKAWDERGKEFTRGGSGLLAQIFQHEIDHLDGILFVDKAEDIEKIVPENLDKNKKKQ